MKLTLAFGISLAGVVHAQEPTNPHAPNQFLHDPDVELQLFAQEPLIVDPVALAFTPTGDAYVIEMRDYPYGVGETKQPGVTIRLLRDEDEDGKADKSILFAENLSFPTSITPWRKGFLVAAPPQIIYFEDSDGDDRADVQRVILDGFNLAFTDANLNALRWGFDNRIHGANGSAGGEIFSPLNEQPKENLHGYDFAFDPDSGVFDLPAHTGDGFGLVFDAWGHSFTTNNTNYLQQRILPRRYLERNPLLPGIGGTVNISQQGNAPRIYAVSEPQTRVNHPEQAGQFSSAGGMGWIEEGVFSDRLNRSVFICDVVGNLVHRNELHEKGPIYEGTRAPGDEEREFIASYDPAFRPVGLETGPDGALYLIDMQRDVIEHPEYIPAKVLEKLDVRAGDDRGRIYRIVPKEGLPPKEPLLADATPEELVNALSSHNPWRAETAHRLIYETRPPQALPLLIAQARGQSPQAKVRAMWLIKALHPQSFPWECLSDPHPAVRENALLASEGLTPPDDVSKTLVSLTNDPHQRVRFQAALSLGEHAVPDKISALATLLTRDGSDLWLRRAVLSAIPNEAFTVLKQIKPEAIDGAAMEELTRLSALESIEDAFSDWIAAASVADWPAPVRDGFLEGLASALRDHQQPPLWRYKFVETIGGWADSLPESHGLLLALHGVLEEPPGETLSRSWKASLSLARNQETPLEQRQIALALFSEANDPLARAALLEFLTSTTPSELQELALEGLVRQKADDLAQTLISHWRGLAPALRPRIIQTLLSRRNYQEDLLTALESGTITVQELNLDLEQRRSLLRWSSEEVSQRAAVFFGDEEYSNRKTLVEEWLPKLPETGDLAVGQTLFNTHCALCHQVGNQGHEVGPDLTGMNHRSVEDLLSHILDPNMAISPDYVTCVVETQDGSAVMGLLKRENAREITLRLQLGIEQTVQRSDIKRMQMLSTSLMPEGLEQSLSPSQLRSLIAFLQAKR